METMDNRIRNATRRRGRLRALALGALLPVALLGPAQALAKPPGGHGHPDEEGPERFIERHADELELSPETREAIEKIAEESRARARKLHEESAGDWESFRALLQESLPDEDEVMKRADEMSANRLAARKNRLHAMLAIRELLTEEQRAKLVEIRESDPRRRRGRGHFHACGAEVAKVCSEAEPGQSMLRCLADHWDELSGETQQSFERGAPMRGPREGRGGRRFD